VKIAANATPKKLFFKLRRAKSAISALQDGDLRPEQVKLIAERLEVAEREVVDMNRRVQGDVSLSVPIHDEGEAGQALDWLVDPAPCVYRKLKPGCSDGEARRGSGLNE
jgi:RNA polymerase sigma-32 factor